MSRSTAERSRAIEILALARQHGCEDVAMEAIASGESLGQFQTRLMRRLAVRDLGGLPTLQRTIAGMRAGKLDGAERELAEEGARAAGRPFDPHRVVLPWQFFSRDLTTSVSGAGGYLASTTTGEAYHALRPYLPVEPTFVERLKDNRAYPVSLSEPEVVWQPTELTEVQPETPTLGAVYVQPHSGMIVVGFGHTISKLADPEGYLRTSLLRGAAVAILWALLNGRGHSGEPMGLMNLDGLAEQSGASFTHATAAAMKRKVAESNADDQAIVFLGHPAVRELLETRPRVINGSSEPVGDRFLWDDDMIASRPARVSTLLPETALVCGDWREAVVALWGPGIEIAVNPYDGQRFRTGGTLVRVTVDCDVAFPRADAFIRSGDVS